MVDPSQVGGVGGAQGLPPIQPKTPGTPPAEGPSFQDVLSNSIKEIEQLQAQADQEISGLVSGEVQNVTQAMVAIERADLAFRTMMEIRNKLMAAYEEINRMAI